MWHYAYTSWIQLGMFSFSQHMLSYSVHKGLNGIRDMKSVDTVCGTWKMFIICWFCLKILKIDSCYLWESESLTPFSPYSGGLAVRSGHPCFLGTDHIGQASLHPGIWNWVTEISLAEHWGQMGRRASPRQPLSSLCADRAQPREEGDGSRNTSDTPGCSPSSRPAGPISSASHILAFFLNSFLEI